MSSESNNGGKSATLEQGLGSVFRQAQEGWSERLQQYEDSIREKPTNSVVVAGVVGYFLHLLPIGALLGGVIRLLAALIRPAVLFYVAAKFFELVRNSSQAAPPAGAPDAGDQAPSH